MNNTNDFTLEDIYFKDAFTKTEDKLNLEVNNATVECITSKNKKFSLDENGNLVVNSISYNDTTQQNINFDQIYPVGSIYMSAIEVNPTTLFGGIWNKLENRFLLGASSKYTIGSTGGEETHKLTVNEIPSHNHSIGFDRDGAYNSSGLVYSVHDSGVNGANASAPTSNTGGSKEHNNMPPYLAVYMWQRIE